MLVKCAKKATIKNYKHSNAISNDYFGIQIITGGE